MPSTKASAAPLTIPYNHPSPCKGCVRQEICPGPYWCEYATSEEFDDELDNFQDDVESGEL